MPDPAPVADDRLGLEQRLGYRFRDPGLLARALTHGSASPGASSNQRLEFLGDAVLSLVVCEHLYRHDPQGTEGRMTEAKARYVNNLHLADVARSLAIGPCLRLGKGVDQNSGADRNGILSDALEAVIGAAYLDGGLEAAASLVERHVVRGYVAADDDPLGGRSSKTVLQEWLQARGRGTPEYRVLSESGPSHDRTYRIETNCGSWTGFGEGSTKKAAEERAAADALRQLVESDRDMGGQPASAASGRASSPIAALAVGIGLALVAAAPPARASVSPEASQSAAEKFERLAEGELASGSAVELSEDELNSFLRFDAVDSMPEGVENPDVSLRAGGAVLRARVDLSAAGASFESLPPLMRLLLRGHRNVMADIDYAASDGYGKATLASITVDDVELSGPLLEWFVGSFAPVEVRPFLTGEPVKITGIREIRLEPGRAVIVAE